MKRLLDTMGRHAVDMESIQPRIEISDNLSEGTKLSDHMTSMSHDLVSREL